MPYPPLQPDYSWEAYLELEAQREERYEYLDGPVVAMSGGTNVHNKIIGRTYAALLPVVEAQGCDLFTETVKLFRHQSERYLYPDLMVTCNPLDLQTANGVRHPLLLIEVLSKTNTPHQMAFKLREYMKLPSLRHYLLVDQEAPLVQHIRRTPQGSFEVQLYDQLTQQIDLPELATQLSLSAVYRGIAFGPEVTEAEERAGGDGDA